MNKEYQTGWLEFFKGITNFILAIVLLLSMSTVEINFMLISMVGLFITNFNFLKDNLLGKKRSPGVLKYQ